MVKWDPFNSSPPCRANCWLGFRSAANLADRVSGRLTLLAKPREQKVCLSSLCWSDFRQLLAPGGKQGQPVFNKPCVTYPGWLTPWYHPSHTRIFPEKPSKRNMYHIGPATLQARKRVKLYHWGGVCKVVCHPFWCRNLRSCMYAWVNARDFHSISTYSFLTCQVVLGVASAQILLSTSHHRIHSDFVPILLNLLHYSLTLLPGLTRVFPV